MSVQDIDRGLAALMARIQSGEIKMTIGVHGDAGGDIPKIASWNHEGTSRIPARPWITQWVAKKHEENLALLLKQLRLVVREKVSLRTALNQFGAKMVAGAQNELVSGSFAPNAPSTIARKGSSRPLVDTGQLKSAHTYKLTGV